MENTTPPSPPTNPLTPNTPPELTHPIETTIKKLNYITPMPGNLFFPSYPLKILQYITNIHGNHSIYFISYNVIIKNVLNKMIYVNSYQLVSSFIIYPKHHGY